MLYILESIDKKFIKIGYTQSARTLEKRMMILSVSSPIEIKLLTVREGTFVDEKNLLNKFKDYKSNGEWFFYNQEIIEGFNNYDKKEFKQKRELRPSYKRLKEKIEKERTKLEVLNKHVKILIQTESKEAETLREFYKFMYKNGMNDLPEEAVNKFAVEYRMMNELKQE